MRLLFYFKGNVFPIKFSVWDELPVCDSRVRVISKSDKGDSTLCNNITKALIDHDLIHRSRFLEELDLLRTI